MNRLAYPSWKNMQLVNIKRYLKEIRKLIRDAWLASFLFSFSALYFHNQISLQTLNFSIAIALGYVVAYGINDYHDRYIDANDAYKAERNFFVRKKIRRHLFVLILSALGLYFFASATFFGLRGLIVLFLAGFIAWAYSSPPLRFKSKPGLDLLVHSFFVLTFPYAATVFVLKEPLLIQDFAMLSLTFIGSAIIQLENQVRDYEVDKLKEQNFTIKYGRTTSSILITILNITVGIIFVYSIYSRVFPLFFGLFGLAYSPLFVFRILSPGKIRSEKTIRLILMFEGLIFLVVLSVFVFD